MTKDFIYYVDLINIRVMYIDFQGGDCNENC